MSATGYLLVTARNAKDLATAVLAQMPTYQPLGGAFLDAAHGELVQTMILGSLVVNTVVATTSVSVSNGDTVAVHNSAGADSHNATAEVAAGVLTDVKFASTIAMVDNADTVVVHSSPGTVVPGTHSAEVAAGVLTDVVLASTVAPIHSGQVISGVAPSGSYTSTVTITVVAGVVTAIALA